MLKFTIKHIRSLSKNIENRCKGKVRKYTKVVIRCKAEQGENKNTNSMTFTHIHFIYDINDVFRAQKLFFQDFRGNVQFKTTIFFFFSCNKLIIHGSKNSLPKHALYQICYNPVNILLLRK